MEKRKTEQQWKKSDTQIFWGEIAPNDHLVQIYDNEEILLSSIEGFITSGINSSDSVIIIATDDHLDLLEERLRNSGFGVNTLKQTDQYIPLSAEKTLAKFMVDGWPNEELFMETVRDLLIRARGENQRQVRAYGEMVALLWAQGNGGATVHLEHLWNKFCATESFCLFCAYPKAGFTQDPVRSIEHICCTHTKVISGDKASKMEVFYKERELKKAV